jgi:SAM-dependent methyltransferase
MNWKVKAHVMAILSRVPGGKRLYHALQSALGTNRLDAGEGVQRAVEVCQLITQAGQPLANATVLEIGTGWRPFVPFLLSVAGVKRIITLDVNPWLTQAYAFETYRALGTQLEVIARELGLDPAIVSERYEAPLRTATTLDALLAATGIEYHYPGDARQTGLAAASVDYVCSSNVLEHVPPGVLRAIHAESLRVLRPGGLVVHRFNPGDHYATTDRRLTTSNFLRYSEREWRWYGGTGLSYHNRLRCPQHREILAAAEFTILVDRVRVDQRAVESINSGALPVHPDFMRFSAAELAADYMWLVGRKPQPVSQLTPGLRAGGRGSDTPSPECKLATNC